MKFFLLLTFSVSTVLNFHIDKVQDLYVSQLYEQVLHKNEKNLLVCPLALQFVFAGLSVGGNGDTSEQIRSVMNLIPDEIELQNEFNEIGGNLKFNKSITLYCIKDIYFDYHVAIDNDYVNMLRNYFHTNLLEYNFAAQEHTSNKINAIIKNATNELIQDLTDPKDFNDTHSLIVINAISFHGKWLKAFDTIKGQFISQDYNNVTIDMLSTVDYFYYKKSGKLEAKFLKLHYADSNLTLTIILPYGNNSLSRIEENIVPFLDNNINYIYEEVSVLIPKFKIESTLQLRSIFESMGIVNAFNNKAQFDKIFATNNNNHNIHIASVIQKLAIEINEEGSLDREKEIKATRPNCSTFIVNKPFLFYIKLFETIVFIGRYVSST